VITHNDLLYVTSPIFTGDVLTSGTQQPGEAMITYDQDGTNAATNASDGCSNCQYPQTLASADASGTLNSGHYSPPFANNAAYTVAPNFISPSGYDFHLSGNGGCGSDGVHCLAGGGAPVTDMQYGTPMGSLDIGAFGIPSTSAFVPRPAHSGSVTGAGAILK
jgi:hypothetical protein